LKQNAPASTEEEQLIHDNIAQIKKLFAELELINYYNIDGTEGGLTAYDEIRDFCELTQ
jgi:hypothetical protein